MLLQTLLWRFKLSMEFSTHLLCQFLSFNFPQIILWPSDLILIVLKILALKIKLICSFLYDVNLTSRHLYLLKDIIFLRFVLFFTLLFINFIILCRLLLILLRNNIFKHFLFNLTLLKVSYCIFVYVFDLVLVEFRVFDLWWVETIIVHSTKYY